MDINFNAKMAKIQKISINEDVNVKDNSTVVNTTTTSSPGGIVINNTANTTNDTTNDTVNATDNENEQENDQDIDANDSGSGLNEMLVFGSVLVAVYMYSRKRRGLNFF